MRADSGCFPLWRPSGEGDLDPAELGLPAELAARLLAWADAYDSSLDLENALAPLPLRAAFLRDAESEWNSFEREGHTLWHQFRAAHVPVNGDLAEIIPRLFNSPDSTCLIT